MAFELLKKDIQHCFTIDSFGGTFVLSCSGIFCPPQATVSTTYCGFSYDCFSAPCRAVDLKSVWTLNISNLHKLSTVYIKGVITQCRQSTHDVLKTEAVRLPNMPIVGKKVLICWCGTKYVGFGTRMKMMCAEAERTGMTHVQPRYLFLGPAKK